MKSVLAAAAAFLFLAAPASGAETITLNEANPALGDYVTFTTDGVAKQVKNPRILVECYQSGDLVYGMGGATDYAFQLGGAGSIWLTNGGPAECTATLFYFDNHGRYQEFVPLATTDFSAGA